MEGSVSSSASQPPGQSPWKIAAKPNNTVRKQPPKVAYSITLALPGKVAFCVPRIGNDPQYLQRLQALIKAQQGVILQQVNPEAGSVIITYKIGMMSDFEMRSELAILLQTADDGSKSVEVEECKSIGEENTVLSTQTSVIKTQQCQSAHAAGSTLREAAEVPTALSTQHSKVACSIVHAIPGRIRFHIPQIACDRQYVQRLENLLKADPVVTSERINQNAASVVITYKTGTLRESQPRQHSIVEAATSHFISLIQSANEATAGFTPNPTSSI